LRSDALSSRVSFRSAAFLKPAEVKVERRHNFLHLSLNLSLNLNLSESWWTLSTTC
jgi:hypothetical protein